MTSCCHIMISKTRHSCYAFSSLLTPQRVFSLKLPHHCPAASWAHYCIPNKPEAVAPASPNLTLDTVTGHSWRSRPPLRLPVGTADTLSWMLELIDISTGSPWFHTIIAGTLLRLFVLVGLLPVPFINSSRGSSVLMSIRPPTCLENPGITLEIWLR